jgi:hypothetical protein
MRFKGASIRLWRVLASKGKPKKGSMGSQIDDTELQ